MSRAVRKYVKEKTCKSKSQKNHFPFAAYIAINKISPIS